MQPSGIFSIVLLPTTLSLTLLSWKVLDDEFLEKC